MATFAEDTLERGLKAPPPALVRVARQYQRIPGGRVVIVDRVGPALLDTHPPLPGRRSFASRPEFASALEGEHRLRDAPLEHARDRPDLRRRPGRLRRRRPRRGAHHLSDLGSRLARAPVLAAARRDRRRRPGGGDRRRASLRAHADGAPRRRSNALPPRSGRAICRRGHRWTGARRRCARSRSEFNETVARLDALLRSQDEFVADASHQLRTPLAALAAAAREPRARRRRRTGRRTSTPLSPR